MKNISVATRIAIGIMLVAVGALIVTFLFGANNLSSLFSNGTDVRFEGTAEAKADELSRYLHSVESETRQLAASPMTIDATEQFVEAYRALPTGEPSFEGRAGEVLLPLYRDVFLPQLDIARAAVTPLTEVVPVTAQAVYLQTAYLGAAEKLGVSPLSIDDALDGSAWSEVHNQFHPAYRNTLEQLGYDDLFIVDPDTGAIVYSVAKKTDFATNLQVGSGSGTTLSTLVDAIVRTPEAGSVAAADFTRYNPDIAAPMAFFGSPIMEEGTLVGVLVVKISTDEINRIMTNNENWPDIHLGATGEVFAIGIDGRFRSDSRLFVEDPTAYFENAVAAGTLNASSVPGAESAGTVVLFQRMDLATLNAAEAAGGDVIETGNYLGDDVFTSLHSLDSEHFTWSVIVQASQDEVLQVANDAARASAITIAMFVLILTFTAVVWAAHFVRPLRVLSARIQSLMGKRTDRADATAGTAREVTTKTTKEFAELTIGIDRMLEELHKRESASRAAESERRDVVRRFLPPDIVLRLEAGERNLVERIPNATIVAIILNSLGELGDGTSADAVRDYVDAVVAEFDAIAAQNGLERVKIVGDTYYAACGLDRPRLDHSPRSIAFAQDIIRTVETAPDSGTELSVSIGVVSGPVDAGLAGSHRLLYDTWGSTVTQASFLARAAAPETILISESVVDQLPPDVEVVERSVEDGAPHVWQVASESSASGAER